MPEIEYVWDELSDNVIEEYEDGVLSVSYDHEPGLYGNLLSQNRNGITSYYHYDGRGDTVALTDDAGNVTDTKDYDAWGNAIASTGSTVTQYQFGGRHGYQTGNTGVYVRARLYQPIVARWLSVDPLWQDVEGSFWKYCENLPISDIDPSGLVSVRVENYSTDSDGPLNCQSKRAGVAYRYSVPKWPCRAISTHQLFIHCEWNVECPQSRLNGFEMCTRAVAIELRNLWRASNHFCVFGTLRIKDSQSVFGECGFAGVRKAIDVFGEVCLQSRNKELAVLRLAQTIEVQMHLLQTKTFKETPT